MQCCDTDAFARTEYLHVYLHVASLNPYLFHTLEHGPFFSYELNIICTILYGNFLSVAFFPLHPLALNFVSQSSEESAG